MSDEIVKIKGTKSGLQLLFAAGSKYEAIEADIRQKLKTGSGFFVRGTTVYALEGSLPQEEMGKLRQLFQENGVLFSTNKLDFQQAGTRPSKAPPKTPKAKQVPAAKKGEAKAAGTAKKPAAVSAKMAALAKAEAATSAAPSKPPMKPVADPEAGQLIVRNRTLRGGQEIRTKGGVLIVGNVNPGAQIIAGGSIDIRGTCRGMVHAGAFGDSKAIIVADHLMPTQIRIADLVARAPDRPSKEEQALRPERASIKDGQIVIEPIYKK